MQRRAEIETNNILLYFTTSIKLKNVIHNNNNHKENFYVIGSICFEFSKNV